MIVYFPATCSQSSSYGENSSVDVTYQQLFSGAMDQLKKCSAVEEEEIPCTTESTSPLGCCAEVITRSSSSASSSSAGCVFEGSEILGEDASVSSPTEHNPCPEASLVDQANWTEYLTLGVAEYNNCSHDDSGFRTETDESLCRTVSSCDLDYQEAGPAPRRPNELSTVYKSHNADSASSTEDTLIPDENDAHVGAATPVASQEISPQGPIVLVENLDTPSSTTSSCDDALMANGQCSSSSTSHSCSSSRDSGLSSMAELEASSSTKNPASAEAKSENTASETGTTTAADAGKELKTKSGGSTSKEASLLTSSSQNASSTLSQIQEHEFLSMPPCPVPVNICNRLRPPLPASAIGVGCSSSKQFPICAGSCCNSECSASLG